MSRRKAAGESERKIEGANDGEGIRTGPRPTIQLAIHEVGRLRQKALVLEHLANTVLSDFATVSSPSKLLLRFAGTGSFEADLGVIAELRGELFMKAAHTRKQMAELLAATIPAGPSDLFGGLQPQGPESAPDDTFQHNEDEVVVRAEEGERGTRAGRSTARA
jgi:hypothetical protein